MPWFIGACVAIDLNNGCPSLLGLSAKELLRIAMIYYTSIGNNDSFHDD